MDVQKLLIIECPISNDCNSCRYVNEPNCYGIRLNDKENNNAN